MKKILLFLLLPLFSFSQDRGCTGTEFVRFYFSINDSSNNHFLIDYYLSYGSPEYGSKLWDTLPINVRAGDSLTFYYEYLISSEMYGASIRHWPGTISCGTGLDTIGFESIYGALYGSCWDAHYIEATFKAEKNIPEINLNKGDGSHYLTYKINWVEDPGERKVSIKLNSSSSFNIATQKGDQTLSMFSMNGQLVYSYSFNTEEWADVNISLPENIFPSGIYILSLVSVTEAQNFKVFVH